MLSTLCGGDSDGGNSDGDGIDGIGGGVGSDVDDVGGVSSPPPLSQCLPLLISSQASYCLILSNTLTPPIYSFASHYMATVVCNIMYNATSGRLTQRGTHLLAPT